MGMRSLKKKFSAMGRPAILNREVENCMDTLTASSTLVTSKRLLEFGFGFAPALIIDAGRIAAHSSHQACLLSGNQQPNRKA